jgi:hypothetical protein
MFGNKNKIAKGDALFKDALNNYEAGVKDLDEKNASDLKAAESLEQAASALRTKVTAAVAEREVEKARVENTIANIKKLTGL